MTSALKHKEQAPSKAPDGEAAKTATPLDHLAAGLHDEMEGVNATIIARAQSHIPLIAEVAEYLIQAGGKRIRPLLTLAAASICGKASDAVGLAAAVEFIHTATLLHDDVVDESQLRRGKPAANIVFGNKATVLVGDFLFARAFELMVESDDIRILEILARASRIISEGEVLQMSLTGDLDITIAQYEEIIDAKTAALFAAACQSGALAAKANDATANALMKYGHHLGMAFQMVDDLIDYSGTAARLGKESGDDFREGKLTLPVILALARADETERAFWKRTMADHDQTPADLATAKNLIAKYNTLETGRNLAEQHAEDARKALKSLSGTPLKATLDELLDFVVARDH